MTKARPPKGTEIPHVLYSCANDGCAEERSFHADDLYWIPEWHGWYCFDCIDCAIEEITRGISLERHLEEIG